MGQRDTVRLQVGEEQHAIALAGALRAVPDVQQASATGQHVVLVVRSAAETLASVVSKASEVAVKIRAVDIQEPNLEVVFCTYRTGAAGYRPAGACVRC